MKKLLLILFIILIPRIVFAAIAHDASTVSKSSETATTCNFTHTAIGTPTLALLFIGLKGDETITGTPTWGGTNMVAVASTSTSDAGDQNVFLYELHTPGTGGKTVDADFSSTIHHSCIAITFTGTHATDATVESNVYDNSGATCTTATTTLTLNSTASWMVTSHSWHGGDTDPFTEANYTERSDTETGGGSTSNDAGFGHGDSTGNTGSLTHTTTPSVTDECAQVSVELIEPAAGGERRIIIGQ